ncbi:MAG: hypothetical protein AB7F79_07920 [Steroidobacteraceae bacterium]
MTDVLKLAAARQMFTRFGDAAWLLTDPAHPSASKTGPVIYICDVESGRSLLLETNHGALQKLSEQADLDEPEYQQVRAALSILIGDLLNSAPIHPDTRRGVILGAAFCTSETRGFHITKHHGSEVQHVLLRYPDAASKSHILTPMPVFKVHPITAVELDSTVTHILLSEQLNFPERFANGMPLCFKQLRRNVLSGGA